MSLPGFRITMLRQTPEFSGTSAVIIFYQLLVSEAVIISLVIRCSILFLDQFPTL